MINPVKMFKSWSSHKAKEEQKEEDRLASIENTVVDLLAVIDNLESELKQAHKRINLANTRSSHIEHYLGLRHFKFTARENTWGFGQVQQDVKQSLKPKPTLGKSKK